MSFQSLIIYADLFMVFFFFFFFGNVWVLIGVIGVVTGSWSGNKYQAVSARSIHLLLTLGFIYTPSQLTQKVAEVFT